MAVTLNDIALRRTGIGTLGDPGQDVIEKVAAVAAAECKWDESRKQTEITNLINTLRLPE